MDDKREVVTQKFEMSTGSTVEIHQRDKLTPFLDFLDFLKRYPTGELVLDVVVYEGDGKRTILPLRQIVSVVETLGVPDDD